MYRVTYYFNSSSVVASKEFESFKEAIDFAITQPENTIIEIKHYDTQINHIQNKSNNSR